MAPPSCPTSKHSPCPVNFAPLIMEPDCLVLEKVNERTVTASYPGARLGKLRALHSLLCPWNVCSVHGHNIERIRPLHKLFRFLRADLEIYLSFGHPRQASYVSSLLVKPATYQSGGVCLFFQSLHGKGPVCEPAPYLGLNLSPATF